MSEYLTEAETSAVANEMGVPVSPRTLANKRWTGNGPPFVKVLGRVRYRRADVIAWAQSQISTPRSSTSDRAIATLER
jgi:hypothetical protein